MREISKNLLTNIKYIEEQFERCADVVKKALFIGNNNYAVYVVYMDSMIDRDLVEGDVLRSLLFAADDIPKENPLEYVKDHAMLSANVSMQNDMDQVLTGILSGNTALFGDNSDAVLMIDGKGFPNRGVPTAESEVSVRGAKDSFSETIRFNTVLIRRRIKDTRLKTEQVRVGVRTKTDIAIMYMDDLVKPGLLAEIKKSLASFQVDGILDSGSLEQYIERNWYSPFPQFQATERPDKTASALMEGRIALVVDNSPTVLLVPATLNCFFQASDDYYYRFGIASFTRVLRYIAALIAVGFPGLYIAAATFHPEIFPTSLALSLVASRQGVPFPLAVEVILMELAFELLREAGIRLPGPMGSALSIVGGLIVGQAAVDAHIVSPVVVIVVALTALASFTIPNDNFASAFRMLKFVLIISGAVLGLLGFVMGMFVILAHMASLESFGVPYLMPYASSKINQSEEFKDSIVRMPLFWMKKRPVFTQPGARTRYRKNSQQTKN